MSAAPEPRSSQYISFFVGGDELALDILRAREIVEITAITRVPRMPQAVLGVLNLRGRVIPVIDLAVRLGLPASVIARRSCILIVETEFDGELTRMGLFIDAVGDVVDLDAAAIEPPPPFGTRARQGHLVGLGKVGDRLLLLLDIDRILSPEELFAAASLEAEGGARAALPGAPPRGEPAGAGALGAGEGRPRPSP
ncbi:chemotaxis protein CheW [Sorangium sp. So ce363]|uniref:chemotaxis protein CheW n=1 Tax=Sorangium sp. So ce363 TaxID=3133304 RepID=UPI003F640072